MEANSLISKSALLFIPFRIVALFFILLAISFFSFKKYFVLRKKYMRFWSTLIFSYLLPVSIVTVFILIPIDFLWILVTGYEFPLNWFLFLKNPILIRFVKIVFDTFFALLLTDTVMKCCSNFKIFAVFVDRNLAEQFRKENRKTELIKTFFLVGVLIILIIWKAR